MKLTDTEYGGASVRERDWARETDQTSTRLRETAILLR